MAEQSTIFARVSPAQKNRIILALKRRGHVVGFMGDGINDAPSLHAADVGISVMPAADVARDAADIILRRAGPEGASPRDPRRTPSLGNMMKYLLMGTSSNFGNMFSMAAASLFLPFLPMLPTQILLNNFLYDLAQITIPTDNVDRRLPAAAAAVGHRADPGLHALHRADQFRVRLPDVLRAAQVFHADERLFHTGWFVESLATQTLVLFVIRTMGNPLRSRPSTPLAITTVAIVLIGAVLPATPLAPLLGFTMPPTGFFVLLAVAMVLYLSLVQLAKQWLVAHSPAHR